MNLLQTHGPEMLSLRFTDHEFRDKRLGLVPPHHADHPWLAGQECWPLFNAMIFCRDVLDALAASSARRNGGKSKVAIRSQHCLGKAADIRVKGMQPRDVLDVCLGHLNGRLREIGGLGLYPGWLHVDNRPRPKSGRVAMWGK